MLVAIKNGLIYAVIFGGRKVKEAKNSITYLLFCLIICVLAQSASADGPAVQWEKTFGGSDEDWGYSVQQTTDGGFIIAGTTHSFGAGSYDVYLVKTDSAGNLLWQKTFGGSDNDFGYSVQQTSDGGFIIAGETSSFGAGSSDVYLVKTDSAGNLLWQKTFGGSNWDSSYSVQQTSDGGFIIAGYTWSFGAGSGDVYLVKTDSAGSLLWQKTFGGSDNDFGHSVQQTSDGGFIIAGETGAFVTGSPEFYLYDVYLAKTDSAGNLLWQKTFGGSGDDSGYSVQQTSDGGFIIAGYTWSFGAGSSDVYLIKTDSAGNLLWQKTFGGSNRDSSYSVQQTSDGGFIIAGYTMSFGAGSSDVYFIKTDSSGNSLWQKTFGGGNSDGGLSVQQTSDGGFIIAGSTSSFGAGNDDVYLIKLAPPKKQKPIIVGYDNYGKSNPDSYKHCTHVIIASCAEADSSRDDYLKVGLPDNYVDMVKRENPECKVLFSLGANGEAKSTELGIICTDKNKSDILVNSIKTAINDGKYDGVDIDWEFPNSEETSTAFCNLMKALRIALPNKLITFAVGCYELDWYSLETMKDVTDYCILMGYDYYAGILPLGPWIASPYDIKGSLEYISKKYPPNRIVLAMPFYCKWGYGSEDYVSWSYFVDNNQKAAIANAWMNPWYLEKVYSFIPPYHFFPVTTWVNDSACLRAKARNALFGSQILGQNIGGVGTWNLNHDSYDSELIIALEEATGRGTSLQLKGIAMSIVLNSHADLHLYDPSGKHTGANYVTNSIDQNIIGTTFNILDADGNEVPYDGNTPDEGFQQVINMPVLNPGTYRIALFGTSNGPFHLAINGVQDGNSVTSNIYEGQITTGERIIADLTASTTEDTLTLSYEPLNVVPTANAGPDQTVYAWIDGIAEVNLDGSGSSDPDGDALTYKWSWIIDGNTYDTNGVKPKIELPVGQYVISLIVNDGIVDSEPNDVNITVTGAVKANLCVMPKVLNCKSFLPKIMTTILLPKGITKDQIDTQQLLLLYPGEIKAERMWISRDYAYKCRAWQTTISAWFDKDDLMSAIDGKGKVELAVVGRLKTGQYFYGTDDVNVICPGRWPWPRHWPWYDCQRNHRWNRWCQGPSNFRH